MKNENTESVEFKIKAAYPLMRKSEKKVADYVLRNQKKVSNMTLSQLAGHVEVSQPTVLRMVKNAGFGNFKNFSYCLKNKKMPEVKNTTNIQIHPWNTFEEIIPKVIGSSIYRLEETLYAANLKNLKRAVKAIVNAKTVVVYAVENSYAVALDITSKLTYLGIKCFIHSDTFLQRVSTANLTSEDVAILVSHSGKSIDTVEAAKVAQKNGAKTIAITNGDSSPLCHYADIILDTGNSDIKIYGNSIYSRITQTAIVDMFYIGIIVSDYERYSKKLVEREKLVLEKHYKGNEENV